MAVPETATRRLLRPYDRLDEHFLGCKFPGGRSGPRFTRLQGGKANCGSKLPLAIDRCQDLESSWIVSFNPQIRSCYEAGSLSRSLVNPLQIIYKLLTAT